MMVEGEMHELQENTVIDALLFGHAAVQPLIDLQERLRTGNGKEKRPFTAPVIDEALIARVKEMASDRLATAFQTRDKKARREALGAVHLDTRNALTAEGQPWHGKNKDVDAAFGKIQKKVARGTTLSTKKRIDGRSGEDIRPIVIETGVLPRAHGSAMFQRGETQALASPSRSAPSTTRRSSTRCSVTARRRSTWTTTSRRSRRARPSRCAASRAARSVTASSPSARSSRSSRSMKTSRTRSASCRTSSSRTARRRWPRCAAARSR
jgi:hypothetical protein